MTPTPDPPGYDEVRRKLLERGYLQDPIERFLLKDLLAPGRGIRRLVRADLKAALLGGPILGALLAGAAAAANRPLVGPRDFLVIWLYFAILSGVALFLLDFAAAAVVGAMALRRGARPSDTLRAALFVGIPTLAYVVVLWWRRNEAAGAAADLVFLAAAVVATVLVAWLAGLVSLAGIVGRTGDVPRRMRRPAMALAAVFAVAAAFYGLLPRTGDRSGSGQAASPFEPEATGPPLVLVGVDGLDGGLIETLAQNGSVEGILSMMARGAVFPLQRRASIEPPEVWTTIATGMGADAHGVRSAGAERLPGIAAPLRSAAGPIPLAAALQFLLPGTTVPTTGEVRRVRTVWEIVALKKSSAAVGWWATWPAQGEPAKDRAGYVVSDRVLAKLLSGATVDRDTWPASLYPRLHADFSERKSEWRAAFEAAFAGRGTASQAAWESFLIDAFALSAHDLLLGDPEVRAAFVYLPGLDILRYRLDEELRDGGPERKTTAHAVLETYLRWLDGRIAAQASIPGRRMVVVADPGRRAGTAAEGFVVVTGPPAVAGCVGPVMSLPDVAPLVLDLAGFPASAEMSGRAPGRCLDALPDRPRVATFGRRGTAALSRPSAFDSEMIDRLRSLGYVR